MMFERHNKVLNIWQARDKEFVLNLIEFIAIEKLEVVFTIVIEQILSQEGFTSVQKDGECFGIRHSVDLFFDQLLKSIYTYHL
jgi:hypothetical protein